MAEFFEGLALVEPGLVHIPLWRPDSPEDLLFDEPERTSGYGGSGTRGVSNQNCLTIVT